MSRGDSAQVGYNELDIDKRYKLYQIGVFIFGDFLFDWRSSSVSELSIIYR